MEVVRAGPSNRPKPEQEHSRGGWPRSRMGECGLVSLVSLLPLISNRTPNATTNESLVPAYPKLSKTTGKSLAKVSRIYIHVPDFASHCLGCFLTMIFRARHSLLPPVPHW